MKALIVGTGGIGARHAANLQEFRPSIELIGVRNAPSDKTRDVGMRLVPDLAAALRERPTLAVVALPPVLHAAVARQLVEAGIPLYLEKPPAVRVEELSDAAAAADERGLVTMVGCQLRRMPGFRKLRETIRSGELGEIVAAQLSVGQFLPDWRPGRDWRQVYSARRELGGGVILDLIHEIDLARFLLGEFDEAAATAGKSGALDKAAATAGKPGVPIDVEDNANIWLRREGLTASIHLDCLDRAGHREGRIIGTHGTAVYDVRGGRLSIYDAETKKWRDEMESEGFSLPMALKAAMAHFVESVERSVPTDSPLSDGLKSLALAERAKAAAGLPA
jgi:predicted dehydrogenase